MPGTVSHCSATPCSSSRARSCARVRCLAPSRPLPAGCLAVVALMWLIICRSLRLLLWRLLYRPSEETQAALSCLCLNCAVIGRGTKHADRFAVPTRAALLCSRSVLAVKRPVGRAGKLRCLQSAPKSLGRLVFKRWRHSLAPALLDFSTAGMQRASRQRLGCLRAGWGWPRGD